MTPGTDSFGKISFGMPLIRAGMLVPDSCRLASGIRQVTAVFHKVNSVGILTYRLTRPKQIVKPQAALASTSATLGL